MNGHPVDDCDLGVGDEISIGSARFLISLAADAPVAHSQDLIRESTAGDPPIFKTKREALPGFVSDALTAIYEKSGLRKGCADLVI